MTQIPEQIDFRYRRPRFLDDERPSSNRNATSRDPERITQETLNHIYKSYQRASDKANVLIDATSKVANKYTIPISEDSIEIRQAINRQDPDSNGSYLSFNLFSRMIDKIEAMATKIDYSVIDTRVIADPAATSRLIRKQVGSEFGDSDNELMSLLMIGGHIMTLFLMHQIQGIWRGPEHTSSAPKTAGPAVTEQASPISEAIREASVGLATSFAILGINETLAYLFASEGNTAHNAKSVIEGAIAQASQVDLPPLVKTIQKAMGLNDHKIILKYAIKYISQSNERGYEFWWAYLISRRTRYLSARSLSSAPMFSKKSYAKLNYGYETDDALIQPDDVVIGIDAFNSTGQEESLVEGLAAELVDGLNRSIVYPTDEYLCIRDYEAYSFERGLNWVAQILDTRLSRDVICCIVRFLVHVDIDTLRSIRAVLSIFLNSQIINLSATMENYLSFLTSWAKDTMIRLVLDLIQSILDKVLKVVASFLSDIAVDTGDLSDCPLILELIQSLVDAIDIMMQDIQEIVYNHISSIELNIDVSFGIEGLSTRGSRPSGLLRIHKKRSIRRLLSILDSIISIIENGSEVCDPEEVIEGRQSITFDEILDSSEFTDIEDYLDIPEDVRATYFKDAIAVELEDGTEIPSYDIGEYQLKDSSTNQINDCGPAFSNEIIQRVLRLHNKEQ